MGQRSEIFIIIVFLALPSSWKTDGFAGVRVKSLHVSTAKLKFDIY